MVTKQIDKVDVEGRLSEILAEVSGKSTHYVVENDGEAVAAVVPMHVYDAIERRRKAFLDQMEATARRVNLPPEEAERLVAEAIEAVRRGET